MVAALSGTGDCTCRPSLRIVDVVFDIGAEMAQPRMTQQQRTRRPEQEMQPLHPTVAP